MSFQSIFAIWLVQNTLYEAYSTELFSAVSNTERVIERVVLYNYSATYDSPFLIIIIIKVQYKHLVDSNEHCID